MSCEVVLFAGVVFPGSGSSPPGQPAASKVQESRATRIRRREESMVWLEGKEFILFDLA
jgi:hypothetical protein